MKLSVLVPVYNEAATVETLLDRVAAADARGLEKEIVVVDDASGDATPQILAGLRIPGLRVLRHARNRGKGAAVRTAVNAATGDFLIIQDADLEYDPNEYPKLLGPLLDGRADVVYGSRFVGSEPHRVLFFWHYVGNRFLTLIANMVTNLNLTDMETCYKAFRAPVLKRMRLLEDRFGFDPEVTAKVARMGCRVYEVGVSYSGRTYAEGKKINWKDAIAASFHVIRYGLWGRLFREPAHSP